MATPQRAEAEQGWDHVSMGELLASCAAARALSTPPLRPEPAEAERAADEKPVVRRDEAA
ncbi:hypothetical protein ACFXGT_04540 [Streptomyces sp. NPDC059352]|uniref:hypothetical protein n=1 Tax=Streptomyces sp. NPDC059352 TaxID=3346810 RepID=UPI00368584A1